MKQNIERTGMRLAVIGAGSRGRAYSKYSLEHPERLIMYAVAEPNKVRRESFSVDFHIPEERQFSDWRELLQAGCPVDAVLIATSDQEHVEPAVAFASAGYNILLEKPMAGDVNGCAEIVTAINANKRLFGVCHVLLYTPHTQALQSIINEGRIGEIVSIERIEPVGYWHFAHSYVRGNWRNEATSSPVLLAKSCHDIDWILQIMGGTVKKVSSFGTLNHFRKEQRPEGSADRCTACSIEADCPYSATRFYGGLLQKGDFIWPLDTVISSLSQKELDEAMKSGPYGRCVYACDNTVVDNQVVNLLLSGNRTASFSMVAFSDVADRKTKIFGTKGMLETDGSSIRVFNFLTNTWEEEPPILLGDPTAAQGHGGGDFGLMDAFITAWETGDKSHIKSSAESTFTSHKVVFAAEQSRRTGTIVELCKGDGVVDEQGH